MGTVPIGTLRSLPTVLDSLGFDGWAFMQEFALGPDSFTRPLSPVPVSFCAGVLHRAVEHSGRDELPLLLGATANMGNLGPLRILIDSTYSVREALDALARFRKLWFPDFQIALLVQDGIASMAIDIAGDFVGHQELCTCYLTAMVRHLDLILGARFPLKAIHMSRDTPSDTGVYRRQLGVRPVFTQPRDAVFFDAALLGRKRARAEDPGTMLFLRKQLQDMELAHGSSFADQVGELIETLLLGGRPSVEKVGQLLGMHRLTVYRRLQAQGTTFEALLDQHRRLLAEAMLRRPAIRVAEVADALGYSAPGNFARAFQRWTGMSPLRWRERSMSGREPRHEPHRTAGRAATK